MRGLSPSRVQLSVQCFANLLSAKYILYPAFTAFIVRLRVATKLVEVPENTSMTFSPPALATALFSCSFPVGKIRVRFVEGCRSPDAVRGSDTSDLHHELPRWQTSVVQISPILSKTATKHIHFAHIRWKYVRQSHVRALSQCIQAICRYHDKDMSDESRRFSNKSERMFRKDNLLILFHRRCKQIFSTFGSLLKGHVSAFLNERFRRC